jgi:hypothetical protein
MADLNDMDDFELNEEEQRFNNMLDGIEEEYDEIIRMEDEEHQRDMNRSLIYMGIGIVVIITLIWAGFYFDLYTVS